MTALSIHPENQNGLKDSASLLGSRICHDLISPLGAISNGLELLAMSGMADSPELKLISESVENANARLKFFRVAFGAAGSGQVLSRPEIIKIVDANYATSRISVRWDLMKDPSRVEVKLGFLSLLCLESALPQGGEILLNDSQGGWNFQAYGARIRFEPGCWAHVTNLRSAEAELAPGLVHFRLLGEAFTALGVTPQVGHSETAVSLRF